MKKMMIATMLLVLSSCVDLTGQLKVFKSFKVKSDSQLVAVNEGQYKTKLDIKKNRTKVTLENSSNKIKFEIKTSTSNSLPQNGPFELRSTEINQPFNILGQVETKISKSGTKSGYESCTYRDTQTICTPQGCVTQTIDRFGQKNIQYYDEYTDQKVDFNITNEISVDDIFGEFSSQSRSARRIIIREGFCR